jgi:hypothetical protein
LQREFNEYEESNILGATEWLFARRRGDPLDERFIHVVHSRMFNHTWKKRRDEARRPEISRRPPRKL